LKWETFEQTRKLEEKEKKLDLEPQRKLDEEKKKIEEKADEEAAKRFNVEIKDLQKQVTEKEDKLKAAEKAELKFREQTRKLEEKEEKLDLELQRKLDEERKKIQKETANALMEGYIQKDMEKDAMIRDMQNKIEELKQKAEQGSMQTQGEVFEERLKETLTDAFKFDNILDVPKGIKGADLIHEVFDSNHKKCGVILWETKSSKNWSEKWIQKLKDDQRQQSADVAIIVTKVMPKEVDNFGIRDGVWVTRFELVIGLATGLRQSVIDINHAKLSSVGQNEKMDRIYRYLSSPEFHQKVESIVETFVAMKKQLDHEKIAMTKLWKEREKQIQRITDNTVGMYGDMQGIIGASLPEIEALELSSKEPKKLMGYIERE